MAPFIAFFTTIAFLVFWAYRTCKRHGIHRAGTRMMLVGIGTIVVAIPGCAATLALTITFSQLPFTWLYFWPALIPAGLLTTLIGLAFKIVGTKPPQGTTNEQPNQ